MNVLFVCTGNICRSPMAEGLFRAQAERHELPCTVRSAGLLRGGEPVATGAISALAARGIDLSAHRSRRLSSQLLDDADLVLTMERRHLRAAVARRAHTFSRCYTLPDLVSRSRRRGGPVEDDDIGGWLDRMHAGRERLGALLADDPSDEIEDPLGSGTVAFEATAERLDALISSLMGTMAMIDVRPLPVGELVN